MIAAPYIALLAAAGVGFAAAAPPLESRQVPSSCTMHSSGNLAVLPKGTSGNATFVGIVDNVKHAGIDGNQASIIVSKDDNGNPLQPQTWEFWACTDQAQDPTPDDGLTISPDNEDKQWGVILPKGASQHCLAVESTQDATTGEKVSILDSYCANIDPTYRTWFFHADGSTGLRQLSFEFEDLKAFISDTQHAELQFVNNADLAGKQEMVLQLL